MSYETERTAIVTWFNSQWSASNGKVFFENQKYTVPDELYLALTFLPGDAQQKSLASTGITRNLFRIAGLVQVDIFSKKDTGTITLRNRADLVVGIFLNKQLTTSDSEKVQFRVPYVSTIGDELERYRLMVTCPYFRDAYLLR